MRSTSARRRSEARGHRMARVPLSARPADTVVHTVVRAEDIPLPEGTQVTEAMARRYRLVTKSMIAKRYGVTAVEHWQSHRDFPKAVATLQREDGRPGNQHLFPAEDVHAWVKAYRPKYLNR